ncbi:4'-phosphopantetheinyl transferase family protein [Streptomyces polyrhachis]|uniref:4'-phosphopantetheinyl transferase family protein n=1 Tax=Streptomyces polyrhachis TaxID=1282885 RepID=A0ABW2GHJ6_9ACTN
MMDPAPLSAWPLRIDGAMPQGFDHTCAVWLLDRRLDGGRAQELACRVLDVHERQRLGALRRDSDRRTYALAHVGLRMLLGGVLGAAPRDIVFGRDACPECGGPHGRPAVADAPVHFSLSHSEGYAMIALARTPVGVDLERVPGRQVLEVIQALHPDETAELLAVPEALRPAEFTRVWTRKEAYLKGLGSGLGRSPALDYVGAGHPDGPPAQVPAWRLAEVSAPQGYCAALATMEGEGGA